MNIFLLNSGHGSDTKGKRSPIVPPGIVEHEFNHDICRRVKMKCITRDDFRVVHIDEEYKQIPLAEICARVNNYVDASPNDDCVFVSVHANAEQGCEYNWGSAYGVATFICAGCSPASDHMARLCASNVTDSYETLYRGVKTSNLYVLQKTKCPATLVECGFMTHPWEATMLAHSYWRNKIAEAFVKSFVQFTHGDKWKVFYNG